MLSANSKDVKIIGSWNGYCPQEMTKNPSNDDDYYFQERLPIGKHLFHFIVDGKKVYISIIFHKKIQS
jgi:hypothetical protein